MSKGQKFDQDKPDWSLLKLKSLEGMIEVLTFGAKKYERDNWKEVEGGEDRYLAALLRHLTAYQNGEGLDDESGLPHLYHAQCCLYFLTWFAYERDIQED